MKLISLTQGKFAKVDDELFDELNKHKWCVSDGRLGNFYAVREERDKTVYMHRQVVRAKTNQRVTHMDKDGLNNLLSNVRICTGRQHHAHQQKTSRGTSSIYKGVSQMTKSHKWRAYIKIDGRQKSLGTHLTEIAAARAYDVAAQMIFDEFAWLNFPTKGETLT